MKIIAQHGPRRGRAERARSSTPPSRSSRAITGQKPVVTRAKKSIATLQAARGPGDRRDGHAAPRADVGVPRPPGHASRCRACATSAASPEGVRRPRQLHARRQEQIIFPEIEYDKIDKIKGMNISFVTTAETDEQGRALLAELGMPFRKQSQGTYFARWTMKPKFQSSEPLPLRPLALLPQVRAVPHLLPQLALRGEIPASSSRAGRSCHDRSDR